MLTTEQRNERIRTLVSQIKDMRDEDEAASFFDEPIYDGAIEGLERAIEYQRQMIEKGY